MADLFGAFDDDDEMEVEQKPVIEQIAVDKMAELETRKKNQAHENTEDLISRLSSGTQKRQATDGAAPAAKISRRGESLRYYLEIFSEENKNTFFFKYCGRLDKEYCSMRSTVAILLSYFYLKIRCYNR